MQSECSAPPPSTHWRQREVCLPLVGQEKTGKSLGFVNKLNRFRSEVMNEQGLSGEIEFVLSALNCNLSFLANSIPHQISWPR